MSRRLGASAALTGPLLIGAMGGFIPQWLELALATPVVFWGAFPFFVRGWQSIVTRSLNMFTLIRARRHRLLRLQRGGGALSGAIPGWFPR